MSEYRYIIKNCPDYIDNGYTCRWSGTSEVFCQDCTDCVMKQIVNHCKNVEEYEDDYYTKSILELLDIQEVE